jgi:hypothetical protein
MEYVKYCSSFPNRQNPKKQVFSDTHRRLSEKGTAVPRYQGHMTRAPTTVDPVRRSPKTNVRFGESASRIWRTLQD